MEASEYAQAGVSLETGDEASRIMFEASRRTWPLRLGTPGEVELTFDSFAAVRFVDVSRFPAAILGMNFDGIGTKIEIAERVGDHTTVAFDLFAMVCDDAARNGGEPIILGSILDCRRIAIATVTQLAQGMVAAARVARVAVINGEIAELGTRVGGVSELAYNWGAGVTWIGRRDRMISGRDVAPGQSVVAIREKGFRSNGLSLVRRILLERLGADWHEQPFGSTTLGRAVLEPSRIYTPLIIALTGGYSLSPLARISAIAHITGGGIPGKLARALLPAGCGAILDNLFDPSQIMLHCQELSGIGDVEAYMAWNMGNGLLVVTPDPDAVINAATTQDYEARVAGEVQTEPRIRIMTKGLKAGSGRWQVFPL